MLKPVYKWADRFSGGSAIFIENGKYGFINQFGDVTVKAELNGALRFREGLAACQRGNKIGFINAAAKVRIPYCFTAARSFSEGLAAVEETTRYIRTMGYINPLGEYVFKAERNQFDELGSFVDNMAAVRKGFKWGFINRKFEVVIEPQFEAVRSFYGGLAAVKVKGKWGYVNKEGELSISPIYDEAYDFEEVLAMVKRDGLFGFIDRDGRSALELQFTNVEPYYYDMARVSQYPNFGYIDVEGNVIWDPRAPADGMFDLTKANKPEIELPLKKKQAAVPYEADYKYQDRLPIKKVKSNNTRGKRRNRRR